jgi:hypothetical protein
VRRLKAGSLPLNGDNLNTNYPFSNFGFAHRRNELEAAPASIAKMPAQGYFIPRELQFNL